MTPEQFYWWFYGAMEMIKENSNPYPNDRQWDEITQTAIFVFETNPIERSK